jgi:hypothetical protein
MTRMHIVDQKLSIICGLLWGVLFFVAVTMMGQFPPPVASLTGEGINALMQSHWLMSKAAVPLGILGAGLAIPFNALIAGHIAQIETRNGVTPLLSITSYGAGLCNVGFFFLVFLAWGGILHRPDTNPDVIAVFHSMIWLCICMASSAPAIQMICIGLAGFRDTSENPVFPRWFSYLMFWVAVGTVTGFATIFFFEGPFSWAGIISFWIPAMAFCIWMISLCYVLYRHVGVQQATA